MRTFLSALIVVLCVATSFGQTQGVSQRATNGAAFGEMIVNNHINATNTGSTNTFAGKFQQGQGTTANGTGSAAFGLGSKASGSYSFSSGIGNQNFGAGALSSGSSNSITSSAPGSFASGSKNFAQSPYELVSGANIVADGSNTVALGLNISMDTLTHNDFVAGQNITVASGASNNFVWNGDPVNLLSISASRSNAFTVTAPGGIFLNGVSFTNGGPSALGTTWGGISNAAVGGTNLIVDNLKTVIQNGSANTLVVTNGRAGVGVTTPLGKLQVSGDLSANPTTGVYGQLEITGSTDSTKRLGLGYNTTSNYGVIQAIRNGASFDNLILNPFGGRVGIGTAAPSRLFDIVGNVVHSGNGYASQIAVHGSASINRGMNIGYDTTSHYGFIEAVFEDTAWENFALQPSGGNVGIGTTGPLNKLDVAGAAVIGSTAAGSVTAPANGLYVQGNTVTPAYINPTNGILWQGGGQITNTYTATATLDFASLVAIGCEELAVACTGAADGDIALVSAPVGSMTANGSYSAYVASNNYVNVRYCALVSGDPASGVFRVQVNKWK